MTKINYADRIKSSDKGITTYIDDLKGKKYQIPTFQRKLVWDKTNIKKIMG